MPGKRKCPSRKKVYSSEIAAKIAMAEIYWRDSSDRLKMEQRAYRCPQCGGFHLTALK